MGIQDTKRALILTGLGWGRLPSWAIERDLAHGSLGQFGATALGRQGETALAVYLAHRTDEPLGRVARILRQALFNARNFQLDNTFVLTKIHL